METALPSLENRPVEVAYLPADDQNALTVTDWEAAGEMLGRFIVKIERTVGRRLNLLQINLKETALPLSGSVYLSVR